MKPTLYPPREDRPTYQIVWWGFGHWRWKPKLYPRTRGYAAHWRLLWGPLEVRRWS